MVENKSYIGFIDDSIEKLIIESFRTEKVIYEQLEVDINNVHTKYFDVSCIPILTKSKKIYKVWWLCFMTLLICRN